MAGPGGGPPRKSHTKSKKGCKTCKKRHIRCDETFPQCRNCTKHNCRCDYQDQLGANEEFGAVPAGSLQGAKPEVEIEHWMQTGQFPFPELAVRNTQQFADLGVTDLRLMHHLCNAYRLLYQRGAVYTAPWISQLPLFLEISGRGHKCVLSALLAFSAQRLAVGPQAPGMINLAVKYRAHALQTIQEALGHFSQENADPILATSIILSWQVDDLLSWNSLMQGVSTVISHMGDWKFSSQIASFAESYVLARPTGVPGNENSLGHAVASIRQFYDIIPKDSPLKGTVQSCWQAGLDIDAASRTLTANQMYGQLAYLRNRVLWMPLDCLSSVGMGELPMMAIAHCFSMACAVDVALPELNGACLGALTPPAIEQIGDHLHVSSQSGFQPGEQFDMIMEFPRFIANRLCPSPLSVDPVFSFTQAGTPVAGSPYGIENLDIHSAPGTPPYPPTIPYVESPSLSEMSVPPSPYLASYPGSATGGHRHSSSFHAVQRPGSIYSERGSLSVPVAHDSPRFDPPRLQPSYSPQPDMVGYFPYGNEMAESSAVGGFASGLVNSEIWV